MVSRANEIYPFKKNMEKTLQRVSEDPNNKSDLLRYYHERVAEGISLGRTYKCMSTLLLISKKLGKPFSQATKGDLVQLVAELENSDLSAWTKRDYKVVLKHFFRWLKNCEDGTTPPEVRWIKKCGHVENKRPILPNDLLTNEEKMAMLRATQNVRDRALLEVMFESGRRTEEILTLHIGDIGFDNMGAKLYVNGKVGEDFVRIISSAAALGIWLDHHPRREDPDSPVWIGLNWSNSMEQMSYSAARSLIRKVARRAGIKKRVHQYLFRHTRIDETQGILTEAQQCMMFGWKFGSRMPAIYMKRYGKHIDNAQAIMNGLTPPKKEVIQILKPKVCARCKGDNSPASKFCNKCGNPLDLQAVATVDESKKKVEALIDRLVQNPDKFEKLLEMIE